MDPMTIIVLAIFVAICYWMQAQHLQNNLNMMIRMQEEQRAEREARERAEERHLRRMQLEYAREMERNRRDTAQIEMFTTVLGGLGGVVGMFAPKLFSGGLRGLGSTRNMGGTPSLRFR